MDEKKYRSLLDRIVAWLMAGLRADRADAEASGDDQAAVNKLLAGQAYRRVAEAREAAWAASVQWLDAEARVHGNEGALVPDKPPYSREATNRAIREAGGLEHLRWGEAETILTRHVEQAGRATIAHSVEDSELPDDELEIARAESLDRLAAAADILHDMQLMSDTETADEAARVAELEQQAAVAEADRMIAEHEADLEQIEAEKVARRRKFKRPIGWARVMAVDATNPGCGFCMMLASRGPVYSSKANALGAFHNNCRCVAVPVYTSKNWPGKEACAQAKKAYDAAAKEAEANSEKWGAEFTKAVQAERKKIGPDRTTEEDAEARKAARKAANKATVGEPMLPADVLDLEQRGARTAGKDAGRGTHRKKK